MNTSLLQKSISRVFPNRAMALTAEILFLLLLGMFAIALHAKLRIPMHLPGKQGLLFVALIVTGRGLSSLRYAASISGMGSALLLFTNTLGFHDPFIGVTYILLGMTMDLIFRIASGFSAKPWILAIACGISWMFIPLFRLMLTIFVPVTFNMFSTGFGFPFLTHLLFGFAGGLAGAGILSLIRK